MVGARTKYDIFISYAREDYDWVEEHLYNPLIQCLTRDGKRPKIFLDLSKEGVKPGQNFIVSLGEALKHSTRFIPVYSRIYFEKTMTQFELTKIFQRDIYGESGLIIPILIEETAESHIPTLYNHIQYLDITTKDWFERLIRSLNFTKREEDKPAKLGFVSQPADIPVNLTLPEIQIEIRNEDGIVEREEVVSIHAESGELHGTLTTSAQKGIALFPDLSFGNAIASTRLVAEAEGYEACFSQPFSVKAPTPIKHVILKSEDKSEKKKEFVEIPRNAEEIQFFDNGRALVAFEHQTITVYDIAGEQLCEVPYSGGIRLFRSQGAVFAIGEWSGDVLVLRDNGKHHLFDNLGDRDWGFNVPGDITFARGNAYVAFWNGVVYQLTSSGAKREFVHDDGIQNLVVTQDRFCVCDLKGNICIYQNGELQKTYPLEPSVLFLKAFRDSIIAIGENRLYRLSFDPDKAIDETYPFSEASLVLGNVDHFVVMDSNGKGLRYDKNLTIQSRFHTKSTAFPISADHKGEICIFRYPDGSRTLMKNERIVYTHLGGPFAISPQGKHVVMGDRNGVKIYDDSVLSKIQFSQSQIRDNENEPENG